MSAPLKSYFAVKFVSGFVSVFEWDADEIAKAYLHRRIVGVIRNIQAEGEIPAQREAEQLFAAGRFDKSQFARHCEEKEHAP